LNVLRELLAEERLAGHQHFAFEEYKNATGYCILACDANGSLTFQLRYMLHNISFIRCYVTCYVICTPCILRLLPLFPKFSGLLGRTPMSSTYAWRPLACLPILETTAFSNVYKDWQEQRQLVLYHNAMGHIFAGVNEICLTDQYYCFADKIIRCGRGFDWVHLGTLGTLGGELAAAEHPHVLGRSCWLAATSTSASVLPCGRGETLPCVIAVCRVNTVCFNLQACDTRLSHIRILSGRQ
jgi:hypothetical protein